MIRVTPANLELVRHNLAVVLFPWLLLLLFVPVLVWTSYHNLISLGPVRRWLAIGLRCSLIVFLAFALGEMHARKPNDHVTVLFVWDRSLSMPMKLRSCSRMAAS